MDAISLAEIVDTLRKQWRLIAALSLGVTAVFAVFAVFFIPYTWSATASIIFEQTGVDVPSWARELSPAFALGRSTSRGDLLRMMLESRKVRGEVVDELNLVKRFGVDSRAEAVKKLSAHYDISLPVEGTLVLRTQWPGSPKAYMDPKTEEAPELAAAIAQAMIDSLGELLLEKDYTEAARRRKLLEEQLQRAREELREAEDELVEYATAELFVSPSAHEQAAVDSLNEWRKRETQLQVDLDGAREREETALKRLETQDQMVIASISEQRNPQIDQLNQRILNLQQQIAEQTEVQGKSEKHPDVASLQSQLDKAEDQLAEQLATEMQTQSKTLTMDPGYSELAREAVETHLRVSEIEAKIETVRSQREAALEELRQLPSRSARYQRLQRQVSLKSGDVARLSENYEAARVLEASTGPAFTVLDEPVPPDRPSGPGLRKLLALAFVVSLALAAILAFWRQARIDAAPEPEDAVEQ
ncbi:MAG: GumC family protein [Armatimonadota bacterium]